jgi:hypothetical protein
MVYKGFRVVSMVQESIIAGSLEFVRTEENLGAVTRDLRQLEHDIDACIKGAQVNGVGIIYVGGGVMAVVAVLVDAAAAAAAAAVDEDDEDDDDSNCNIT